MVEPTLDIDPINKLSHPDILLVYDSVLTLVKLTKYRPVPFNPKIIIKLLVSFEDHLKLIYPKIVSVPDFMNIFYTLIEDQISDGFIIPSEFHELIISHRKNRNVNHTKIILEELLINNAKMEN